LTTAKVVEPEELWAAENSRRLAMRGVIFFAYFLLDKQKKVGGCRATPGDPGVKGQSPFESILRKFE
jgi:hypothetical protein